MSEADLRERVTRLERQVDATARECAHLRANVPDLDDLRRLKEVASVPDYYLPLLGFERAEVVTVIHPRASVTIHGGGQAQVPLLIRGLVTPWVLDGALYVDQFFVGQKFVNGGGVRGAMLLGDFKEEVRAQTTWRIPQGQTATIQVSNPSAVSVYFSGALVCKEVRE